VRLFLDTNVLVSALTTRGLCWDLFNEVLDNHALLISEAVITELRRVLTERLGIPRDRVEQSERELRLLAELVPETANCLVELADEDDAPIVSSAVIAQAVLFVTGDKVVLAQREVDNMAIVSPRQCWERLRAEPLP
jgi:putative PIN family toxin of toxin-antitoxin system